MLKLIIRGCNGRMGKVITEIVKDETELMIVAGLDITENEEKQYPVYKSLDDCLETADVLVDFASPKGINELLHSAVNRQLPLVLCATGYTEEELWQIRAASADIPVLRSANMSLGINAMIKLIKTAAKVLFEAGFDIEIIEKHHNQKLDAPSGTALLLADSINEELNGTLHYLFDRSGERRKRGKDEIGISAVRGGNIVGEHEVIFAGMDETIEIKHTAYSRTILGKGAVQAAAFLAGKPAGMYSMTDVIG